MKNLISTRVFGIIALTLLLGSTVSTGLFFKHPAAASASPGESSPSTRSTAFPELVCFGFADLEYGVTSLYPLQPGRVAEVFVHETQEVAAGAPLLRMEDRLARLRLSEAAAALKAVQEQMVQARQLPEQQRLRIRQQQEAIVVIQQKLSEARNVLERKEKLLNIGQLNAEEVAIARDQVKEAEAGERAESEKLAELRLNNPASQLRRAEAEVSVVQAKLDQAQYALDECILKAPNAGTVLRLLVGPGDALSAQSLQPAIMFCAKGQCLVRAEVEQEFAGRVTVGSSARVEDYAAHGEFWEGKVKRVSNWFTQRRTIMNEPFQFNDVRTVECLIALESNQPSLRIGQKVRVTIRRPSP